MIFAGRKLLSPIGLDLGTRQVKAVQLRRCGSRWNLTATASIARKSDGPVGQDEARRIADVLERRGFRGSEVVLAVPSEKLLATNLELPLRTPQMPFEQIARQEFARALKQDSESFEFAYWDLPAPARAAKATHVMAVGCATAQSEPVLQGFGSARLNVIAVDVEACALARACTPLLAPPEQITAIFDIGWQSSRLSIVHQGTSCYWRCLSGLGMSALHKLLAKQLDVPDDVVGHLLQDAGSLSNKTDGDGIANQARRAITAHIDALMGEVTTSLSYAAHQYPDASVSLVLLVGGGAAMPGISDYFAAQLGMEVRLAKLNDLVEAQAGATDSDGADSILAAGLAQHLGE